MPTPNFTHSNTPPTAIARADQTPNNGAPAGVPFASMAGANGVPTEIAFASQAHSNALPSAVALGDSEPTADDAAAVALSATDPTQDGAAAAAIADFTPTDAPAALIGPAAASATLPVMPASFTPGFVELIGAGPSLSTLNASVADIGKIVQGTVGGELKSYQVRAGADEQALPGIVRPLNFNADTNAVVFVQL